VAANSPDFLPLVYHVWERYSSLITIHKLQPKTFKDALHLICFALPEKAVSNTVKDFRKRLHTYVSAIDGYFGHKM